MHESPYLQLPHVDDDNLKVVNRSKSKSTLGFQEFIRKPQEKLEQLKNSRLLKEEQLSDIQKAVEKFPKLALEVKVETEDEESIEENDVIKIAFKVTREHLESEECE